MQLYHCFVSQSSEFCRHNPLCCFSTSVYYYYYYHHHHHHHHHHCLFRWLSPGTFGYTLVWTSYGFSSESPRSLCKNTSIKTYGTV